MPGLGHVYLGDLQGGILRYLGFFFSSLCFLFLWRVVFFQPHLPLLVMSATLLLYLLYLVDEIWQRTGPDVERYILQSFNHPMVYGALLLLCHLIPGHLVVDLTCNRLMTSVQVQDGAMFPMLFIGDEVLVDRTAYRASPPSVGELIVLPNPDGRGRLVRRVIALPGDVVALEREQVVVNGRPLSRAPLGRLDLAGEDNRGLPKDLHLQGYQETNADRRYTVAYIPKRTHEDVEPLTVSPDHLYVMADNRDAGQDSRGFGVVPLPAVLGRPLHVLWSRDPRSQTLSWPRLGLESQ